MDTQNSKNAVRAFAATLANAISESLEAAIGSPWPLELTDSQEPASRKTQPAQIRLKLEGKLRGECFIEFYEPQLSDLLSKLGSKDAEAAENNGSKALADVISSAAAALTASLSSDYGAITFRVDSVSGLAFGGMFVVPLAVPTDASGAAVLLYFDGQLMDSLAPAPANDETDDSGKRLFHPSNLKLVMDVELNVSLRFGQRLLPLRELLELKSGSVIELDRMVDEPVELLLDGKLVARGEAVIVDGNYGLRVTEIPQAIETHFLR